MVNINRMLVTSGIVNLNPEQHNQYFWACGTSRCFGGWAIDQFLDEDHFWVGNGYLVVREGSPVLQFGDPTQTWWYRQEDEKFVRKNYWDDTEYDYSDVWVEADTAAVAAHLLDIENVYDRDALFDAENSLADVNRIALALIQGKEYEHSEYCGCGQCSGETDAYEDDYYDEYDADAAYEDDNPL